MRQIRLVAVIVAVLAGVVGGAELFIPRGIGEKILGDLWAPARALLPAVLVQRVAGSVAEVFLASNRAFGRPDRALLSRFGMVAAAVATVAVVGYQGALASAWSLAAISAIWLVVYERVAVD